MLSLHAFWRAFLLFVLLALFFVTVGVVCRPSILSPAPSSGTGGMWSLAGVLFGIVLSGAVAARLLMLRYVLPMEAAIAAANKLVAEAEAPPPREASAAPPRPAAALSERLASSLQSMNARVDARIANLEQWRASLDQNNQQLAIVLEAMVEGVIAVDSHERILLANTAAIRLLDLKPAGLTGRPVWEAIRLPRFQEVVRLTLDGSDQQRIEMEVPRTQSTLAAVMSRLPGEPCPGAVIVLHDVTDLRRLESLRREFVSNVSHELKTPLAAISAYAETLLDGALEDPDINRGFVSRIGEQADRLHTLILELLELGRMESDEYAFELEALDLGAILRASVEDHQDVARSKSLTLEVASPDDPAWCLADLESVRTIADNLLGNAINYTPASGRITVRWRREADWMAFDVEDTGVGIAKENQARIFERFYRVDKARSREVGGTGLGLSIVKHLCQVVGGQIKVTSQLGKGSTFTVRLRSAEPVENQRPARLNGSPS